MKFSRSLYFWVIIAFISGSLFGLYCPQTALLMEPLGTNFIKLVKVFIGPIVFLTIVTGIAQTGSLGKLGKVGIKAFIYFEIVSTIALLIGWAAASLFQPGSFLHADIATLDTQPVARFLEGAEKLSTLDFLQNIIPSNIIDPFAKGDMLQILFLALITGISLLALGESHSTKIVVAMEYITHWLFKTIRTIMYLAPIGVFGAMAFTLSKFGGQMLLPLLGLIGTFYFTGLIFIGIVLATIAWGAGFSLFRFLRYISPELLLVLGTSSSESALPQLLSKLEKLGCQRETVGVVVPMGYSFNLDGTNIYITLAALFIAQALGIQLTLTQEIILFATAMVTSKGAAGVTGAGFITLAATLSVVPTIPAVGIVLILGIDRFMSEARALINFIGNGVATIVISRWGKEMPREDLREKLEFRG